MGIIDLSVSYIGMSIGSSNTYIYKRGKGVAIAEPSVIAIRTGTNSVVAIGSKAKSMIGRAPDTITVIKPIKYGVISDFRNTVSMIRNYVERSKRSRWGLVTVVSVPVHSTTVERRAVKDAVYAAYGKTPLLILDPIAAAAGCGLNVFDKKGFMVVDIGGGSTEISIVSNGGVDYSLALTACSGSMDKNIVNYIKRNNNVLIGEQTAEKVKIGIGRVCDADGIDFMTVSGRDILQGLPESVMVSSEDIREAVEPSVKLIVDGIVSVIEKLPTEMISTIMKGKILLVGAGAKMRGWARRISDETGIDTVVADNPAECVAIGAGGSVHIIKKLKGGELI